MNMITTKTGSVVRAEFRERYAAHGGSCGDLVAIQLAAHCRGDDGRTDPARLRALAERNGIDFDRYASLNPGQARMNVGNRLRGLVRKGEPIVWDEPEQPAKPAKKGKPRATSVKAEANT